VSHPVQHYSRWFTDYPSTHAEAGATVEVVVASEYEKLEAENERLRELIHRTSHRAVQPMDKCRQCAALQVDDTKTPPDNGR
jgi:hypothetical protein